MELEVEVKTRRVFTNVDGYLFRMTHVYVSGEFECSDNWVAELIDDYPVQFTGKRI